MYPACCCALILHWFSGWRAYTPALPVAAARPASTLVSAWRRAVGETTCGARVRSYAHLVYATACLPGHCNVTACYRTARWLGLSTAPLLLLFNAPLLLLSTAPLLLLLTTPLFALSTAGRTSRITTRPSRRPSAGGRKLAHPPTLSGCIHACPNALAFRRACTPGYDPPVRADAGGVAETCTPSNPTCVFA